MRGLTAVCTGPLATFQDLGRPGFAHLGVPTSGAADRGALRAANRLVGNDESAVGVEVTLGGFAARAHGFGVFAVTGPTTTVLLDGRPIGSHTVIGAHDGQLLEILTPPTGLRNYLAVRGGFAAERTLGSASTDSLSGLGPPPLSCGQELDIAASSAGWPAIDFVPAGTTTVGPRELTCQRGPRWTDLADPEVLLSTRWTVNAASNRIGVRLDPAPDDARLRHRDDLPEQPSEGTPWGGIQVQPSGQPVLFLADRPVTGGYPIVAVLTAAAVDVAAQLRPADSVRLRLR